MSQRDKLVAKFKEALARGQYDVADEYFHAAMEEGAKKMDALAAGSGKVWRDLAATMKAFKQ